MARQCYDRGPGWAQQAVVLQEFAEHDEVADIRTQQKILTCWHDLFREGALSWGYNLDNPGFPWFHLPERN
jgi:hypothetical protein